MSTNSSNEPQSSPPSASILVVDDEALVRSFLTSFLGRKGYKVAAADSGENALEVWKQMDPSPRLLITDLSMPKMSGVDVAMLLKRFQPGIKVLFITGFGPELMEQATSAVTNSYHLLKPFAPDELASAVESALSSP
jgi:two-component system cell cycle sensor histidine kinase/response regulator CckA